MEVYINFGIWIPIWYQLYFLCKMPPYANHILNPVLQNKVMQSPRPSLSLTSMSIPTLTLCSEPTSWRYPLTGNSELSWFPQSLHFSHQDILFSVLRFFIGRMRRLDQKDSEFLSTKFLTSDSHREKLGLLEGLNNSRYLLIGM